VLDTLRGNPRVAEPVPGNLRRNPRAEKTVLDTPCRSKNVERRLPLEMPASKRRKGSWGGRRAGAGRPRIHPTGTEHRARPELSKRSTLHITLRMVEGTPSLTAKPRRKLVEDSIAAIQDRLGVRVHQFAVQAGQIDLIVRAPDVDALARTMRGLQIRIARGLNQERGRTGRAFAGRYQLQVLRTARQVRGARAALADLAPEAAP
jgi:REP element-mobilizing transposase RayT